MKLKRFMLFVVVSMAMLWAGCGGGKSSSTSTTAVAVTVSPTTASIAGGGTQQFTATVTGSTNTAVTWAVNLTVGGNAQTGTISTSGLYTAPTIVPASVTQTIVATSQADTSKTASAIVTITTPTVTISIAPASNVIVPAGGMQQFTPTVTSSDNNTAVTWSVNGCPVALSCGTVSSTGLYTAPLSPPKESITVTATSVSNPAFSASAPITVQFDNASLNGHYVFLATQGDNASGSGFALRAGTFFADGTTAADGTGNITGGIEDSNSSAGAAAGVPFSGTYKVGVDGRGTMTINDGAPHIFQFALTSSVRGQMIGFDSSVATGFMRQQDQTAISAVSGPFVFGLSGDNGGPAVAVGQLNFSGSLITGSQDSNTNGVVTQGTGITGSFSVPAGERGTAVVNTSNFAYYIIDASTLALIDIDGAGPRLAGTAYAQSTSAFTAASLGSSTYFVNGNAVSGNKPYAQAGRFDTDGIGKLNGGIFDSNNAGTVMQNIPFSNTSIYALSGTAPTNGRGTIMSTGASSFIFWLASPSLGVIMDSDSTVVAEGLLFRQQTGITSVTGAYEFATGGASADGTVAQAVEGQMTVANLGVLSGNQDSNAGGTVQRGVALSGNLAQAVNDRSLSSINGVPFVFYFTNGDRFIMLSTSSSSVLSGVGERQCSDCQF